MIGHEHRTNTAKEDGGRCMATDGCRNNRATQGNNRAGIRLYKGPMGSWPPAPTSARAQTGPWAQTGPGPKQALGLLFSCIFD